jgi:hypothetical protein
MNNVQSVLDLGAVVVLRPDQTQPLSWTHCMKEFFLILFFSKTILLTPDPINLFGEMEIIPDKPLKAITSGATIQLDVSSMIGKNQGITEFDKTMEKNFPAGSFQATLYGSNNKEVTLRYDGHYSFSDKDVRLTLSTDSGVPTDAEFSKVRITSSIRLKNIKVFWKNYKH